MEKISLINASKLTSPNPVTLVCTKTPAGITNLAAVSWWTYMSLEPETVGFAMMKPSYTGEMMRSSKKAIIAIPGTPLARQVMECGTCSGREVNKAERYGIGLVNIPGCGIQIPRHTVAAIECSLRQYLDVGDHYLYICDVPNVWADQDETALFAWKGYAKIAPASMA